MRPELLQKRLFHWFDQHGRKHLPWQQNKTPYRVWVSEIMLQQTQVSTVIPYFERFVLQYPDLSSLAAAKLDDVLHLWAGLGYYSRARNLHRAAQMVMEQFSGNFPDTLSDLQSLPGIGQSTAGAILAIAFNQRATILDGNVKRVLARLHNISDPVNEKLTENLLWQIAADYTPHIRVADYTQAIMDLGATLCTRSKPDCQRCPLQQHCDAYANDMVVQLPVKKASRNIPTREATFLIIKKNHEVYLYKRPEKGIWGGLFSLPEIAGRPNDLTVREYCRKHFSLAIRTFHSLPAFKHTFSHYHLMIHPVLIEITKLPCINMAALPQIWYNIQQPKSIGLPKPVLSIVRGLASCA